MTPADLQSFVDPLVLGQLAGQSIAGAVVVIVKDGAVVFRNEYGHADVAAGRAMGPDTLVRIGSITKTVTALAVMQLVEAGRLDLDRDVNQYIDFAVPTLPGRAPVTLRRLLSHQAGFEDRRGGIGALSGDRLPLGPFLARHMPPRLRQNDDVVAYSNFNAALAAYIVERASGQSFEQYVAEHIFQPLQMTHTTAAQPLPAALLRQVSNGYVRSDLPPTIVSMAATPFHEVGSTGVATTGADMGRLLIALLDPDPGIVTRASLDTMMAPQAMLPRGFYGLGMFSPLGSGGNAFIGHDGGTGSFGSTLALLPQERFGLFASYNSSGTGVIPARAEILQRIAERYFPDAQRPPRTSGSAEASGAYAPTRRVESNLFALRALVEQLNVRLAAGGTLLLAGVVLDPVEPGVFRGSGIEVAFDESGTGMQLGPVSYMRAPWWASAGIVAPVLAVCVAIAGTAVVAWPVTVLRRRRVALDPVSRRLQSMTRLALLLNVVAIVAALWLVLWGWPLVALSSPIVAPLGIGIYAAAWAAVLLTPVGVWHAVRFARRRVGGFWAIGREILLVAALVLLTVFSLQWRIAGTTLAF